MTGAGPSTKPASPPSRRLRVGVSACFFHADPQRNLFKGKTLLYAEESMLAWLMSAGVMPVLVPRAGGLLEMGDFLADLDGLVLQGGSDMSPLHYGEEPVRPEWAGDGVRDLYEMDLVRSCLERRLPLLGVCRGAQVLNVALGACTATGRLMTSTSTSWRSNRDRGWPTATAAPSRPGSA
jgi:putative glutamine amidotransferase